MSEVQKVVSNLPVRGVIDELEERMRQYGQVDLPPVHYFAEGLYAREIFIPKGTLLTGKIHKSEHINIISKGDISVLTEDGVRRIKAPCTIVSRPGTKRVGYTHEDTVWTTIHAATERDLDALENTLIAKTYDEVSSLTVVQLKELMGGAE